MIKRIIILVCLILYLLHVNANIAIRRDILYTHNNHLGSAAWITRNDGKPIQYIHYLPYGQLLANQMLYGYDERFKFIGKERDWESGYDYFGARYYISPFIHFASVEPLLDKYLHISPYSYAAWNPIKFVDSDGRWVHIPIGAAIGGVVGGLYALKEGKSWSEVGAATLGGSVAGGITAATAGLGSGVAASVGLGLIGGAVGGATGNLTEQGVNIATGNQQELDVSEILISGAVSAATESVGGILNGAISNTISKIVNTSTSQLTKKEGKEMIRNEIKNEYRHMGNKISNRQLNKLTSQRIKSIVEFEDKTGKATNNIIKFGVSPVVNSSVENEIK